MLDGGDVQTLWEYGPKGYYYNVKDDGSFEFLPTKTNPKTKYSKAHIDCNPCSCRLQLMVRSRKGRTAR